MKRVAIVGASGFVGTHLVEVLRAKGGYDVQPWIHSTGNAWALARRGAALEIVDVTSARQVRNAMKGCHYVVNCARNGNAVMIKGLKNMLSAARSHGVERFVHLSSVAVYGEPPPPESALEDAPAQPAPATYGAVKLRQDDMVEAAARAGLPCVTLCPPNITGAGSYALMMLVDSIRDGKLVLVDEGRLAANWVDVRNLVHAIELGFTCTPVDGRRIFVTDDVDTTWKDTVEALAPLAECELPLPSVSKEEAARLVPQEERKRLNPIRSLLHLVSGDVRAAMRKDPIFAKVDRALRGSVGIFPTSVEDKLRLWIAGPTRVAKVDGRGPVDVRMIETQLREVRHKCIKAREVLKYDPPHSFAESMRIFGAWYRACQGMDLEAWPLIRELVRAG
ncbi:MAG: NAD-dependent epimerase/dehydratase family protein [Planctomycetota bacterium]|jgi:nucleoside-diphosphate-sugar epimerase